MQVEMATGSVKGGRTSDLEETSNSEKSRLFFGILALLIIGPMCTWGPIIGSPCLSFFLYFSIYETFLKTCEDLHSENCQIDSVVNFVNVVKT